MIKTDIANFYDSIDVSRLVRKLRRDAPELSNHINLLEVFLSYWNRRTAGYQASSRGIPQEIISDGSRNLSHYYLQDFDEKFIKHCNSHGMVYVRWADDMLIFGNSKQSLEASVHHASRLLLQDGLNLNSSKTMIFSRRDFERYRGLRVLGAIDRKNSGDFRRELHLALRHSKNFPIKLDTIFRASIGFLSNINDQSKSIELQILFDILDNNPDFIGTLNSQQLYKLIMMSSNPPSMFDRIIRIVCRKDITGPKALILTLLRKSAKDLLKVGVKARQQERAILDISNSSTDSDMLAQFCIPYAQKTVAQLIDPA